MNYMKDVANPEKQWQLHYGPACQKAAGAGRYKGCWIPEFRFTMGQRELRFRLTHGRNGNYWAPSSCLVVFVCAFCVFLRIKNQDQEPLGL